LPIEIFQIAIKAIAYKKYFRVFTFDREIVSQHSKIIFGILQICMFLFKSNRISKLNFIRESRIGKKRGIEKKEEYDRPTAAHTRVCARPARQLAA
jgi:hypothetical protein